MILKELNSLLEAEMHANGKLIHGYGLICPWTDQVNGRDFDEYVEVYLDETKFCQRIGQLIEETKNEFNVSTLHSDPEIQAKLQAATGKKRYRDMSWDELTRVEGWDDFAGSCVIMNKF